MTITIETTFSPPPHALATVIEASRIDRYLCIVVLDLGLVPHQRTLPGPEQENKHDNEVRNIND